MVYSQDEGAPDKDHNRCLSSLSRPDTITWTTQIRTLRCCPSQNGQRIRQQEVLENGENREE